MCTRDEYDPENNSEVHEEYDDKLAHPDNQTSLEFSNSVRVHYEFWMWESFYRGNNRNE